MTEPIDRNGHTADELRREASRHRHQARRCELRDNFPAIWWHEDQARLCDYDAWELETPR